MKAVRIQTVIFDFILGPFGSILENIQTGNKRTLAYPSIHFYNPIMSQVLNLYRLQKIDSQKDQSTARLNEIERILQDNAPLKAAREELSTIEKTHWDAENKLKRSEDLVKNQQMKIELSESALYGGKVHNPKELQDLQNELASLKKYLVTLEDQQLDAMLVMEESETQLTGSSQHLSQVEKEVNLQNQALVAERDRLKRDLERIQAERSAVASSIPANDISTYERLRTQRRGVAVATIIEETCSACGSTLTPADRQSARSPNQISFCSTCGRILYAG